MLSSPLVSCIIPTMNRKELLNQALHRLFETTKGIDVEAIVVVDKDLESAELAYRLSEWNNIIVDFSPEQRGAINAWNIGLKMASADIFFHQGDDLDYTDGWLDKVLESHQTQLGGYGLCGVNDSMHNGNVMATHFIFDRKFCKEVLGGVMAPTIIKYYGVDVMDNELAKQAGKFYWREDALVTHLHPASVDPKKQRPVDSTDADHMIFWEADQAILDGWRSRGRKIEWEAVI